MIKVVITDFSRVLLFPKDTNYSYGLNKLNNELLANDPEYSFFDYFVLNNELLEYYSDINRTVPVHIFTSENIQDHPSIANRLNASVSSVVSASKLKIHKSEPSAYAKIIELLSIKPSEAMFIDDKQSNLDVARQVGINTALYTDNASVIKEIKTMISS